MSRTYILNPNDTIVLSDSIVMKVTDAYQACVNKAETNCNDVKIVFIICAAIVLVALIAMGIVWLRKWFELKILKEEFENKKKKEEEDSIRKQEATLLEKKLEILKDLCYGKIEKKKDNNSSIQEYLKTIDKEIKALKECSQTQEKEKEKTITNENQ